MSKIYIGIDPDLIKSGYATYLSKSKCLDVCLLSFLQLINTLTDLANNETNFTVIIEAGWLNKKSNFRSTQNKAIGEAIARKVGENHAVGKIIEQVCQELKIDYKLVKPTTSKVKSDYFFKLTGIKTKNQECIDAAMLVYGL